MSERTFKVGNSTVYEAATMRDTLRMSRAAQEHTRPMSHAEPVQDERITNAVRAYIAWDVADAEHQKAREAMSKGLRTKRTLAELEPLHECLYDARVGNDRARAHYQAQKRHLTKDEICAVNAQTHHLRMTGQLSGSEPS